MCYIFYQPQYSIFHETPNKDDNKTAQWNSIGPGFYLKSDTVFHSSMISSFIWQYKFIWE